MHTIYSLNVFTGLYCKVRGVTAVIRYLIALPRACYIIYHLYYILVIMGERSEQSSY